MNFSSNKTPAETKFDNYSISPKIRQTLLHWGYELVKSDTF